MTAPLILWFRRDLRLSDHPMLAAAVATGRPLIPVVILDSQTDALGAAPKWRWGLGVGAFAEALAARGSRVILRRGEALPVLEALVAETGAAGVMWSRAYDGPSIARDSAVKAGLKARGLIAQSHPGHLMQEPWQIETGQGGPYRVFTPFWNALRGRDIAAPVATAALLPPPSDWPASDRLEDWHLGRDMRCGAAVVGAHQHVGEAAAQARLAEFLDGPVDGYAEARDLPGVPGTSGLSENLSVGEIGIRTLWHAGQRAMLEGRPGAGAWLRELGWREFAWHLLYHFPDLPGRNWKSGWEGFPWAGDSTAAESWRRGLTGEPFVDAAMREMYVTGRMHNRARMIAASYLTKHLLTDWRVGLRWFGECLTDWDPAANAMGWQWVAGCGPDASPYFRIFNPATQAERHDPDKAYRRRFLAHLATPPAPEAAAFFDAVPRSWNLTAATPYPPPLVDLARGRALALSAYASRSVDKA